MRRWTLAAAAAALLAATLWHLPATAQRATYAENPKAAVAGAASAKADTAPSAARRPAAGELITFGEYRDFRLNDIAQRQTRLARELASPDLSAQQRARLEGRKAYYDGLAAMPADRRDRLFRARFDQIDTNHDGRLDDAERAAWRTKQHQYYSEPAAERAAAQADRVR
jgi:hypothetical protein